VRVREEGREVKLAGDGDLDASSKIEDAKGKQSFVSVVLFCGQMSTHLHVLSSITPTASLFS
jgi:hypothetical protein